MVTPNILPVFTMYRVVYFFLYNFIKKQCTGVVSQKSAYCINQHNLTNTIKIPSQIKILNKHGTEAMQCKQCCLSVYVHRSKKYRDR